MDHVLLESLMEWRSWGCRYIWTGEVGLRRHCGTGDVTAHSLTRAMKASSERSWQVRSFCGPVDPGLTRHIILYLTSLLACGARCHDSGGP